LYPEADKLGKQFKYAAAQKIPFVAILGEEERERGEVSLKDLSTGEQRRLARASVAAAVHEKLGGN
jgi:histidyl-tRNA synthetase